MPRLRNCAIDAMLCRWDSTQTFDIGINQYVYQITDDTSPLRKLLVRMTRKGFGESEIQRSKDLLCSDFAFDILYECFGDVENWDWDGYYTRRLDLPEKDFCEAFHMHSTRKHMCQTPKKYLTHTTSEN